MKGSLPVKGVALAAAGGLVGTLAVAVPAAPAEAARIELYSTGALFKLTGTETAIVGASGAMWPVLAVAGASAGWAGPVLLANSGYIIWNAMIARARTPGRCLWVWVPRGGKFVSAGSFAC